MKYVYILRSVSSPKQRYVGITGDLRARLNQHNSGCCVHSKKFSPWVIETYVAFSDEKRAVEFERYLKKGSGREFARRHFASV